MKVLADPETPVKGRDGATGVISAFAGSHVSVAVRMGAMHSRKHGVSYFTLSVVEATEVKKGVKVRWICACFGVLRCMIDFPLHATGHCRLFPSF